jgi:hypothetical protein
MHKGRNNNARNSDENDASKKRTDAGKYLCRLTDERMNRAHSAQDHRRANECVQPRKVIEAMVTDDPNPQSN